MTRLLELVQAWGPLGTLVISFIDGLGIPNPGGPDYLLLYLAYTSPETAWWSALLTCTGSLLGTFGLFLIARKGGEKYLEKRAQSARAQRLRRWFGRYGLATVFIPGLVPMVPLPMKVFVLCAGAMGVRPVSFLAVVTVARTLRYFGLAWLGREMGANSTAWLKAHVREFGLGALALVALCYVLVKISERYTKRSHANPA